MPFRGGEFGGSIFTSGTSSREQWDLNVSSGIAIYVLVLAVCFFSC